MSLHRPAARAAQTASRSISAYTPSVRQGPTLHLRYLLPRTQRRHASWNWRDLVGLGKKKDKDSLASKISEQEKQELQGRLAKKMTHRTSGDGVFADEIDESNRGDQDGQESQPGSAISQMSRAKEHTARALDPDPRWRMRWQRKKVMQMVRNADKPISRAEHIKRTEKEQLYKSDLLPTSTKKLMFLARQLSGKTIDDAITQMRFSKKKLGKELVFMLNEARDQAIVARGMGIGRANGELLDKPKNIVTKDGKRLTIEDPTQLYLDQTWVGKGRRLGVRIRYGARGRASAMVKKSAYISFVLKEEKTRIRLHDERVDKAAKKKPWVHLPNRPVTSQRPYYSW